MTWKHWLGALATITAVIALVNVVSIFTPDRMPAVWAYQEVHREITAVCGPTLIVGTVVFDADPKVDDQRALVAYFIPDDMAHPFAVNLDMGEGLVGEEFLLDYDRDGVVDSRVCFPSSELGDGPCDVALRVHPKESPVPQPSMEERKS